MSKRRSTIRVLGLTLAVVSCSFSTQAQAPSSSPPKALAVPGDLTKAKAPTLATPFDEQSPIPSSTETKTPGRITGTVVDQTGAVISGAWVKTADAAQSEQQVFTDAAGQFSIADMTPGPFQLSVTASGFATQTVSGILRPGASYTVPTITLILATAATELRVVPSQTEIAQDQIKVEEKQRVFGAIPNFYVSYNSNAVPLSSKQKFQLAWKTTIDPVNFGITAAIAGVQQSDDSLKGYGQGGAGYGRRLGANYGDFVIGTFIGSAVLPSLLKQDPRYFYRGTGSKKSRLLYALSSPFICKGDNGRWQPNYSYVVGNFAAAGIANYYYPANDRGAGMVAQTALIRLGENAVASVFQEFIVRKLTPKVSNRAQPQE